MKFHARIGRKPKKNGWLKMLRLSTATDMVMIQNFPLDLRNAIKEQLELLDSYCDVNRNIFEDEGGYVLLAESQEDIPELIKELRQDITDDAIPEYVDVVRGMDAKVFTQSLFLLGNEFGIVVFMPYRITPQNILNYIN